jgi:hypothetical protein
VTKLAAACEARHAGSVLVRVRGEGLPMTDAAADATRENCPKTRNSREGRCAPPGRAAFARTRREPEVRTENYDQSSEVDADSELHRPRRIALREHLPEIR